MPLLDLYESIFAAINYVIAHMAPPITCVFMLGVFWGRLRPQRKVDDVAGLGDWAPCCLPSRRCTTGSRKLVWRWIPPFFYETPFMMMAFYMFCACVLRCKWCLSFCSAETARTRIRSGSTGRIRWTRLKSAGWPGLGDYRVLSAIVVAVMLGLYWAFR